MAAPDEATISVGFVGSLGRACFSDLWLNACPGRDIAYRTGTRRALLAAVRTDALDIAVYPGTADPGRRSVLLCDDHLVVALGTQQPLAEVDAIGGDAVRDRPLLLPMGSEDGEVRRLVQALVPGLDAVSEVPMAGLLQRLTTSDALALVADSQRDELRGAVTTRAVRGLDTRFPVHLTWSERTANLGAFLAARISQPPPSCAMDGGGSGQDDAGDHAGKTVLG